MNRPLNTMRHPSIRAIALAIMSTLALTSFSIAQAQNTVPTSAQVTSDTNQRAQVPGYFRFNLGKVQITALYDGVATLPAAFFKGISPEQVESHWKDTHDYTANGIEDSVNAYLINTGNQLIMVDAGGSKCFPAMGELIKNLRQATSMPYSSPIFTLIMVAASVTSKVKPSLAKRWYMSTKKKRPTGSVPNKLRKPPSRCRVYS